jgi:hypothetical protein
LGTDRSEITDPVGNASFKNLSGGLCEVAVAAPGYATTRLRVEIGSETVTSGSFVVTRLVRLAERRSGLRAEVIDRSSGWNLPHAVLRFARWQRRDASEDQFLDNAGLPFERTADQNGVIMVDSLPAAQAWVCTQADLDHDGRGDLDQTDSLRVDLSAADTVRIRIEVRRIEIRVNTTNVPEAPGDSLRSCTLFWEFNRNMDTTLVRTRVDLLLQPGNDPTPVRPRWIVPSRLEVTAPVLRGREVSCRVHLRLFTSLGDEFTSGAGPFLWSPGEPCDSVVFRAGPCRNGESAAGTDPRRYQGRKASS